MKQNFKIIQDTEGIFEQGFFLVIDMQKNSLLALFQFKIEAIEYIKTIKLK